MGEGDKSKDLWDKLQVILHPVGGLLTAGAIAMLGFVTSSVIDRRQAMETNTRLYSELMSKREESESTLRQEVFKSVFGSFLSGGSESLSSDVLKLELLVYNFHDSLNLKPLFFEIKRRIDARAKAAKSAAERLEYSDYEQRLETVARETSRKEMIVLEGVGQKIDLGFDLSQDPIPTISETRTLDSVTTTFEIRADSVEVSNRQVRLDLTITIPSKDGPVTQQAKFWVSFFDFPMIDNTRLPQGQRCAVVLNNFNEQYADATLLLFPGAYASLKEKPYYTEVIGNVLSASKKQPH